ncbi:Hydroxyethylthiazole kinase [Commensalibacter sp. Nvir]|uniref:hydroxyethylthiazole kinase n=1 Tax=Commensalibacter sp. Nvir TaxID=3069817 RepID=UPI002D3E56F2|nr:Hydroxyethylthiazole kinase [Commensalibacter sp. Nvir]
MYDIQSIADTLNKIRQKTPLIHNITNIVASNYTANALLSLGASPAMINAEEEVSEFVLKANALVINLGTLTKAQAHSMKMASLTASCHRIPWVLDPVGVGASNFRSTIALELVQNQPNAIRGNASEILTLYHICYNQTLGSSGRGVDSLDEPEHALNAAKDLATSYQTIVSISGKTDYITDGKKTISVHNGHNLMPKITGSGCSATAITAACLSVEEDTLAACAHAMVIMGLAGELASHYCKGPGSLQMALLDELYCLTEEKLIHNAKIQFVE